MPSNEDQSKVYEFRGFRLDVAKRTLTREDGDPVPLTPKVFDTLCYLLRNSGKVIEKAELMREIWPDAIVEENNLSQNISILRRIFGEKPGEGLFIATVPGRGFRFVPEVAELANVEPAEQRESADLGVTETVPAAHPSAQSETELPTRNRSRYAFIAAVLAVAVISIGFYVRYLSSAQGSAAPIKTIAILPFKPLVAEGRSEALEIGMADTLISRLGSNRELIVRPLSSVRKFGGLDQDAALAGKSLEVAAVLDGSIQRWGDDIRVNARLIRVADGAVLWTATFDEKFEGLFGVQDAISSRVASALELRLGRDESTRLTKRQTENIEAYQLYLRGRVHVFKLTPPEVYKGIAYFEQAISIDQKYALAYAGLADAYRSLALGSETIPTEFLPKAKAAGLKAVEIDENLPEAHAALAATIFWFDWNWEQSENHYKQALELDPNNYNAHLFYSHLLSNLGRHAEALDQIKLAREIDPVFPFGGALEGQSLAYAGRLDEALERLQKTSDLDPNFWMPHLFASGAYMQKGMFEEALEKARLTRKLAPTQTASNAFEGYALAKLGRTDEARNVLDELLRLSQGRFVPPYHIALIYSGLGETDKAIAWLERGFEQRDPKMTFMKVDSKLDNLRSDPRFIDLIKRMNLQ